jgi:hypothetical protein
MLTMPYDATRESLFHPGNANDFFKHGPISSDAALCAEMARLAYVKEPARLEKFLTDGGFTLTAKIGYDNSRGTQAFVAARAGALTVVAFRGTEPEDPTDLFADARFERVAWTVDGMAMGTVHRGFAEAFRSRFPDDAKFRQLLAGSTRALFTGHSLGAALATLAASVVRPDHLYTFGSPLVGDEAFRRGMHDVDHGRYVDCCDLVTRVPPEFLGYTHLEALRYIDRNGSVLSAPADAVIEGDRREASLAYLFKYAFRPGTVPVRELADHAPINYVSAVMGLRP